MSITSGIANYYEEKGKDGKTMLDLFIEDPAKTWTPDELINRARTDLKPHFPPGKGLYYSDTSYQLLGKIIENVTHTSLANALQNYVFRPLGLQHTWLTGSPEPPGLAAPAHVFDHQLDITTVRAEDYWADGGLVSTPTDMIAFLRAPMMARSSHRRPYGRCRPGTIGMAVPSRRPREGHRSCPRWGRRRPGPARRFWGSRRS